MVQLDCSYIRIRSLQGSRATPDRGLLNEVCYMNIKWDGRSENYEDKDDRKIMSLQLM